MGTKLGIDFQMFEGSCDQWDRDCHPKAVLLIWEAGQPGTLNLTALNQYASAGIPVYIRPHVGSGASQEGNYLQDPVAGSEIMMGIIQSFYDRWPHWAGVQVLNETGIGGWSLKHAQFVQQMAYKMRAKGWTGIFFNFPVGNPSHPAGFPSYESDPAGWYAGLAQAWQGFMPGVRAIIEHNQVLGLNQYAPYNPFSTGSLWWILRHRAVLKMMRENMSFDTTGLRIMFPETGRDGGADNLPTPKGWRGFMSVDSFANQLRWLDAELHKDKEVEIGFVFCGFMPYFDNTFMATGETAVKQAFLDGANIPHIPDEEEPPMPTTYEYVLGFLAYYQAHPEIGPAASAETYDGFGNNLQLTEKGILYWHKATNTVRWWATNPF
jgi:hypothetical protein